MKLALFIAWFLLITTASARADYYDTAPSVYRSYVNTAPPQSEWVPRLTVDAGFITSTIVGPPAAGTGNIGGFVGGTAIDIGPKQFVGEIGLRFLQQGFSYIGNYSNGSENFTANYLSIPVFAKYYFSDPNKGAFFVKLGALNSFLLGGTVSSDFGTFNFSPSDLQGSGFDFSPAAGVGGLIPLSRSVALQLLGMYSHGVTPALNSNGAIYFQTFSFTAGVAFRL
jgi:hypothetical protein